MKRLALSTTLSLLFLGITTLYLPTFFTFAAEENEEITIDKRIKELRRRQIDPAIIAKRLAGGIQQISEKIDLSPEDQKRIQEQMKKLQRLVAEKKRADKYTQSEAHLSLGRIRRKIAQTYPNLDPYLNIISSCLAKEGELKKTHYVFYHAQDNIWRVPQDLYRKLYEQLNPLSQKIKDFEFMRWSLPQKIEISSQEFVVDQLRRYGLIDDTKEDAKALLLSANLALFGNIGDINECTWEYFMNPQSHKTPAPTDFEGILDTFGISHGYIDELMNIAYLLRTKEQTLLQIFVPRDIVDYVSYLSFPSGMPADKDTRGWIINNIKRRKKYHKPHRYMNSFREITKIFKEEQEENPLFKNLLERAEEGDFSVYDLLEIYRNNPRTIDNINWLEARLVFTKNILLNPGIGIKFLRYDTISREKMEEYNQKLDEIVNKMVQELLNKPK